MRTQLSGDVIDRFLPGDGLIGRQAKCRQSIAGGPTVAEHAGARLTTYGDCLMPLNRIEVIGDRGGHVFSSGDDAAR